MRTILNRQKDTGSAEAWLLIGFRAARQIFGNRGTALDLNQ